MRLEQELIKTDVRVIGGSLAGCMAAIRASEIIGSKNVLVVEKSNVRRSLKHYP
jgi:succinate dehydrogenase/fumarate reductase flavoprotein subunit